MPILLRSVAKALEGHLLRPEAMDYSNLHWISVEGEECLSRPAKAVADDFFERNIILAALSHGHSEGSLIHVYAQADRYDRAAVVPIFLGYPYSAVVIAFPALTTRLPPALRSVLPDRRRSSWPPPDHRVASAA